MSAAPFLEEDFRVLTPEAFEFVLTNELKRAIRSQNFVTLVTMQPKEPSANTPVREIARLVSRELRETDLLSASGEGQVSMLLLDADLQSSGYVIERVMLRLNHYQFSTPVDIEVRAACCPTNGADLDTLRRMASPDNVLRGRAADES